MLLTVQASNHDMFAKFIPILHLNGKYKPTSKYTLPMNINCSVSTLLSMLFFKISGNVGFKSSKLLLAALQCVSKGGLPFSPVPDWLIIRQTVHFSPLPAAAIHAFVNHDPAERRRIRQGRWSSLIVAFVWETVLTMMHSNNAIDIIQNGVLFATIINSISNHQLFLRQYII